MDKEYKLLQIAENQQGFFTSRQAVECGFSRANFHRKIKSGKWHKEEFWGIYRLANYPSTSRPELALLTLWSADKSGIPQGVFSHETALEIHGLSDVTSSKLHMSVPRGFRKSTNTPIHLCLHYVDPIPDTELEIRQGYRVTTPLRSLTDVVQEGSTQWEQIEQGILDLAIQQFLNKGMVTLHEVEQIQTCAESEEKREVIAKSIDKVWTLANNQLIEYGRLIEPYTIGLSLDGKKFGTAVLCQYNSKYFFLTAGHIGQEFNKAKTISLLLRFDHIRREYPQHSAKIFNVIEWDPSLKTDCLIDPLLNKSRDLAIIIPPQQIIDTLNIFKAFYKISEAPAFSLSDTLVSLGGIELTYSAEDNCNQLNMGPFAFIASSYQQLPEVDYITCPVSNHTYEIRNLRRKATSSFEGLSGSGLWKFVNDSPILIGIAIAQDPSGYDPSNHFRNVYFHGPYSILSALSKIGKIYDDNQ